MNSRFSITTWLVGSLIGAVIVDLALVCFVSGTDLLLGQSPQLMVPMFALIVSSCALVAVQRLNARVVEAAVDETSAKESRRVRTPKSAPQAPAYLSMTIIKRPSVYAASPTGDEWKGAVQ